MSALGRHRTSASYSYLEVQCTCADALRTSYHTSSIEINPVQCSTVVNLFSDLFQFQNFQHGASSCPRVHFPAKTATTETLPTFRSPWPSNSPLHRHHNNSLKTVHPYQPLPVLSPVFKATTPKCQLSTVANAYAPSNLPLLPLQHNPPRPPHAPARPPSVGSSSSSI